MASPFSLDSLSDRYRVKPGKSVDLGEYPTNEKGGWEKPAARETADQLLERLESEQEKLAAGAKYALLVVLQAMDTGGKDSTIRHLSNGLSLTEAEVSSFKAPTEAELRHDYLWRIHQRVPPRGKIGIFNRSHYEDVLIVRVKELVPRNVWERRYDEINQFESFLTANSVQIIKFYLHISHDFQTERLRRRLTMPSKQWKLSLSDLKERDRWDDYQKAYEAALSKCSTKDAPWYIIPAEHRWYRDLVITQIIVEHLESLKLEYPPPSFDPKTIKID